MTDPRLNPQRLEADAYAGILDTPKQMTARMDRLMERIADLELHSPTVLRNQRVRHAILMEMIDAQSEAGHRALDRRKAPIAKAAE